MSASIKKNAIAKVLLTIVNILIPIFLGPYTARILDVGLYSEYNRALTLFSWFLPFALFGIPTFGLREISSIKDDISKLNKSFSRIFYFHIFVSFFVSSVFLIFILLKSKSVIYYLMWGQLLTTFLFVEYVNEGFEKFGFILYKNLLLRLAYIVLILVFVRKSSDIIAFACISIGFGVFNNIFSYIYIRKYITLIKCSFYDIFIQARVLFPVLILSNTSMLYTNLDCLFLSGQVGNEITYYMIVRAILMAIANVFLSIIVVTIPRLSFFYAKGSRNEFLNLLKNSSNIFYFFILPSCVGLSVLGNQFMDLYGGVKYSAAGMVMSVFSLRFILSSLIAVATDQVLFTTGNEKKLIKIYLVGGLLNILGNFLLLFLRQLTAVTVIITTIVAETLVIVLQQLTIRKIDKDFITINKNVFKYIFISAIVFLSVLFLFPFPNSYTTILSQFLYILKYIFLCMLFYAVVLFIVKDGVCMQILAKIKGLISKKLSL